MYHCFRWNGQEWDYAGVIYTYGNALVEDDLGFDIMGW